MDRALALATKKKDLRTLAAVHLELGLLARDGGDLTQALQHVSVALDLDKQAENPAGIAYDLENLGGLYQEKKMWPDAARELDRAIYLYAALADRAGLERIYEKLEANRAAGGRPESMAPYQRLRKTIPPESMLCQ